MARELGVKLHEVSGSARGGRVTIDDVKTFVRKKMTQAAPAASSGGFVVPPLPDFSKYGPIEKKPVSNIRRKIAENLTLSGTSLQLSLNSTWPTSPNWRRAASTSWKGCRKVRRRSR